MKLIFLSGPPAVGKLTVAKQLARLTGYKLFHNQLTVDLVIALFDWGSKHFTKFTKKYLLELLEHAARVKLKGVIFTCCYCDKHDRTTITSLFSRIKKYGGEVNSVQLVCSRRELFRRVLLASRKRHCKITTTIKLKQMLADHDMFSLLPFKPNLRINNTKLTPRQVAQKIKEYYQL